MKTCWPAALVPLLAAACAQNAFLELSLHLPSRPSGQEWFAQVLAADESSYPFDVETWGITPLPAVPLGTEPQWSCMSIQTHDATMNLNVAVRFCRSSDCADDAAPERLYRLEHPFYIGSRTYYEIDIPSLPPTTCASAEDCELGVCIAGTCGCSEDTHCGSGFRCHVVSTWGRCVEQVERCSIAGCVDEPNPTSFCTSGDGPHFCERFPGATRSVPPPCTPPP